MGDNNNVIYTTTMYRAFASNNVVQLYMYTVDVEVQPLSVACRRLGGLITAFVNIRGSRLT